ncbi:hypothetical protein PENSPDRAFT_754791 [Peniophora sp. CONT]|nr:hypothetical protein PENSPDRAFT_754791 [Peniophora sp. CONT]
MTSNGSQAAHDLEDDGATSCIRRAEGYIEGNQIELALAEAEKASKVEPQSVDAWACLGKSQRLSSLFRESVASYKRAQSCLPAEDVMSETDKQRNADLHKELMQSLTAALKAAKADTNSQPDHIVFVAPGAPVFHPIDPLSTINQAGRRPWERGMSMVDELSRQGVKTTSAFVIVAAYREYNAGVQSVLAGTHEATHIIAPAGATQWILEGLMRDPRCCELTQELGKKLRSQVKYEIKLKNGWDKTCSYDRVRRELQERVRRNGWQSARPALRATVQAWILYAFTTLYVGRQPVLALKYFKQAVNILEFGRATWPNVHRDDRGAIFEDTFLFGVKRMTLPAYMDPKHPDRVGKHHLDELEEFAKALIREAESTTPAFGARGTDHAMIMSYYLYPIADSYSALGWVNHRRAERLFSNSPRAALDRLQRASADYVRAADILNEDEEYHAHYLSIAVECMWMARTPLKDILPLCARIRTAIPKMKRIWAISQVSAARDIRLQQVLDFETEYRQKVQRGEVSVDDPVRPKTWGSDGQPENDAAFVVLKE